MPKNGILSKMRGILAEELEIGREAVAPETRLR